jgi:hypothetical protein
MSEDRVTADFYRGMRAQLGQKPHDDAVFSGRTLFSGFSDGEGKGRMTARLFSRSVQHFAKRGTARRRSHRAPVIGVSAPVAREHAPNAWRVGIPSPVGQYQRRLDDQSPAAGGYPPG